ncbi:hypothetical protein [Xylocopilactobacillus apicola]|uniref:Uncharacterized protein n=1 Tax=Xylocopilactobacillus apicola TaxID=2932184 RepID=A0AAU9DAK8_9LACO|nr:hypothetical protein [Xylocopilactobacillus apicola]BDR59486.1 hypothetical protein XA3_19270 [Xylocopilactobacillus apicola]
MKNKIKIALGIFAIIGLVVAVLIINRPQKKHSNNQPVRHENLDPVFAKMNSKELEKAKDKGIALTPRIKVDQASDLVGKSFSFNTRVFTERAMKYPGHGEYFLRLNEDQTFVLVYNHTFKDSYLPGDEGLPIWLEIESGDYIVKKDQIKLNVRRYSMIDQDSNDQKFEKRQRINEVKINYKLLSVSRRTLQELPPEVQNKIKKDNIIPDNEDLPERFRDENNYVIKKKDKNWRFAKIKVDRGKDSKILDTDHLEYKDYLHEYDHVYKIPNSINDLILGKIKKGEVSE